MLIFWDVQSSTNEAKIYEIQDYMYYVPIVYPQI